MNIFPFTELDTYADYSFNNGIRIRVNTGEMTLTSPLLKYEMYVFFPNGNQRFYGYLNKELLIEKMNELNELNTEE
jgi:hypothetical protein